jgi:beta-glucosidase
MTANDLSHAPYRKADLTTADRVADLLGRMTLAEKLAQLGSAWVYEVQDGALMAAKLADGIGQITRIGGATILTPSQAATLANRIQRFLREETRLGIPAMVHEEACAGYMARGATIFPQIIGLASTWNPDLAEGMGAVIRQQMRAAGAHQALAPVLDVARDPRWGRVEETFGEDPYLVARLGTALVSGLQSADWRGGIIATGKHFVGYGLTDGGLNWNPAHIPARELREVFLFPFEAAVKEAGLMSMMNGYNEIDGVPCAAAGYLLSDILRAEWSFDGLVVSDYFAIDHLEQIHAVAANASESAALALAAGIDVELPSTYCYGRPLRQLIEAGELDVALLDRSVARVLRVKFELGLFEDPYVDENAVAAVFGAAEPRDLAREIARQSIVLLENGAGLLPLAAPKSLAVIGPSADSTRNLMGDYSYEAQIEMLLENNPGNIPFGTSGADASLVDQSDAIETILAAVTRRAEPEATVLYAPGCAINDDDRSGIAAAVAAAEQAEVAIVVVGDKSGLTDECTSGEARDRAELGLPGVQQALVEAVIATGTPTVVVLVNGRPLALPWIARHAAAVVEAWLPGQAGGTAIAEVLFGDTNPGGKLPMTVPRSVGQVPIFYGHKPSGGRSHWKTTYVDLSNEPLYPFGYGLSYTTFALANLRLSRETFAAGETVEAAVDVTNTGERAGDAVIQLYARDTVAALTRPVLELKGFLRIAMLPGETATVTFKLSAGQLGYYDGALCYVVEPGTFELSVGTSSVDRPLRATVTLLGDAPVADNAKVFFSETTVLRPKSQP